ncbi:probable carboxylesterase 8 [Olea europaea subsp. europaea]|uniref:Probable carboxylesterase 8 n=2 Tax=Olea europaea subsp. europaea TaxID=158383 RepID=A0A8S0SZR5_OLEEU|nr:probable carboxylesterase 8 [Olea europaea subsp. europaea]
MLKLQQTSWHTVAIYTLVLFLCFSQSYRTIMADPKKTVSHTWKEVFQVLGFNVTLTREIRDPIVNATPFPDPNLPNQVALSKDVPLNPPHSKFKSFIRLFVPVQLPRKTKLPLIIYIHGGGFVSSSPASSQFHEHCKNMSARVQAVVASVNYRLAPEHPLPAAYEDAFDAISWVHYQARFQRDLWLEQFADFSRVFIMGSSAGANIAYHVSIRASYYNFGPLKIQGVLLDQPFFGAVKRTSSELRLIEDAHLPLYMADAFWTLALPFQANRDHEFSNPFSCGFERDQRLPRWFVKDEEGDPMVDRAKELVRKLVVKKVPVVSRFYPGGFHGVEMVNMTAALTLFQDVKNFIYNNDAAEVEVSDGSY